ncbi:MAG: hypothetical protein HQ569_04480 [Actinobacteria bacterium]|nr:hypothetical protein [Actinomycetota bacterium]
MSISSAAQAEALQWEKEQASTLSAYQKATLAQSGGTGAGTGSNMFTIPGTNHKITVQQAINAGYVKPGQYADKPEPSVWDFIAGGGDTSDVKALATFMSTGKITSTPNTPISNTVPASKYRYAGYGTAADSKW